MQYKIIQGNCLEVLKTLPDNFVQTTVTSSPYWFMRDYHTPPVVFGGRSDCHHVWEEYQISGLSGGDSEKQGENPGSTFEGQTQAFCSTCNAWKGQLGLEPTPELFVEHMTEIAAEILRVTKPDGTFWLNIGDKYFSDSIVRDNTGDNMLRKSDGERYEQYKKTGIRLKAKHPYLKNKDLVGIPWMVAKSLQRQGWYVRSDIIWNKPNGFVEPVQDRPTKSHEHIFLFSKSSKYLYNWESTKIPVNSKEMAYRLKLRANKHYNSKRIGNFPKTGDVTGKNMRDVWSVNIGNWDGEHSASYPEDLISPCILMGSNPGDIVLDPFCGSGTTLYVAMKHGRKGLGIELNPDYIAESESRLSKLDTPLFEGDSEWRREEFQIP